MFSQVSVCPRGCLPHCMLGYTSGTRGRPPRQTPSWADTPQADTPRQTDTPLGRPSRQTFPRADTPLGRHPQADTPLGRHPPRQTPLADSPGRHPPGRHPSGQTPPWADTTLPRTYCSLPVYSLMPFCQLSYLGKC